MEVHAGSQAGPSSCSCNPVALPTNGSALLPGQQQQQPWQHTGQAGLAGGGKGAAASAAAIALPCATLAGHTRGSTCTQNSIVTAATCASDSLGAYPPASSRSLGYPSSSASSLSSRWSGAPAPAPTAPALASHTRLLLPVCVVTCDVLPCALCCCRSRSVLMLARTLCASQFRAGRRLRLA